MERYSRAEHIRLARAAKARGLKLIKTRARILSATNAGLYQLQDGNGRVIAGALFDASLHTLTPKIFASPLRTKKNEQGRVPA